MISPDLPITHKADDEKGYGLCHGPFLLKKIVITQKAEYWLDYQNFRENPDQLIPAPVATLVVQKIFEMAASGIGITDIV